MTPIDVAVAGCGPAGMATALLLTEQGHRVRIHERFVEPGPVGSGLLIQPTGLAVLERLGLAAEVKARGAPIRRLHGKSLPSGDTALEVRYDWLGTGDRCGYGIHRADLFDILHRRVGAVGVAVEGDCAVRSVVRTGRRVCLAGNGWRSREADLIVDTMGASSPLAGQPPRPLAYGALWATLRAVPGFAADMLEQRYRGASRMCGVLPIGGGKVAFFWSLRQDRLEAWRAAGLKAWKDEVRELWPETAPLLDQIDDPDQLTFARYAHRTLRGPVQSGVIHIGDAWHSTSPQLGQGANMALLDAWALACGLAGHDALADGLAAAVALRRGHVRLYQGLSRLFTPAYQSDGVVLPVMRDLLVKPLSKLWPAKRLQAEMVAGTFGGPLKRLGLR